MSFDSNLCSSGGSHVGSLGSVKGGGGNDLSRDVYLVRLTHCSGYVHGVNEL